MIHVSHEQKSIAAQLTTSEIVAFMVVPAGTKWLLAAGVSLRRINAAVTDAQREYIGAPPIRSERVMAEGRAA